MAKSQSELHVKEDFGTLPPSALAEKLCVVLMLLLSCSVICLEHLPNERGKHGIYLKKVAKERNQLVRSAIFRKSFVTH